jgi:hypothetical protein
MRILNPEIRRLREQLRKLDCSQFTIKSAALGGDQDMPFEQSFSNLAHAYLKDKAPSLQDYEVGFQLIDRNQENTKAIGVFGFKVGSTWIYAPVFFLNGDMKGHELLYLKDHDMFVPLKENWLNFLLNRKPNILGHGVDKDLGRLGVLPPNMYQMTRSPAKFASAKSLNKYKEWARPVLPDLAYFATTSPLHDEKYNGLRNALDLIKDAGAKGVYALARVVNDYPAIGQAINDIYGEQVIDTTVKEAAANERLHRSVLAPKLKPTPSQLIKSAGIKRAAPKTVKVTTLKKVMTSGGNTGATLDDDEKETLLRSEISVKDTRDDDQVTIAFDIEVQHRLQNPSESGLYEVLSKPGEFIKCLVIFGPYAADGRRNFATLVDPKNGTWISTHPSQIWTHTHYERAAYDKWFEGLKEDKLRKSEKSLYVLVGPTGQGTLPFKLSGKTETEEGQEFLDVEFQSTAVRDRAISLPQHKWPEGEPLASFTGPTRIIRTGIKGRSLKAVGLELLVPDGYKVIKLEPKPEEKKKGKEEEGKEDPQKALEKRDKKNKSDKDKKTDPTGDDNAHSEESPILFDLGTIADFELGILKTGGLQQFEVRHTGSHIRLNGGPELDPIDALVNLIEERGLREKQARDMVDIAREKKVARFLLKMAASPYDLQQTAPTAPPFPEPTKGADPALGGMVETQPGMEAEMPIPGMGAASYDRSAYDIRPDAYTQPNMVGGASGPNQNDIQTALNAAQSGQREVFDTAVLGSLLKAVHDDTMVDKYMGDLMKGMDRLGRVLFLFYWHQDQFEERYGKQDLPELEDGLRNAFEAMGDIVLFLKQKTIEPHPGESGDIDLKSIAS